MNVYKKKFTNDKVVNKRINDFLNRYYMTDKGIFFWKKRWFSICSAHCFYKKDCKSCNIGSWNNVWGQTISELISILLPKLSRWLLKFKKVELINLNEEDESKGYRRNKKQN